MSFPYTFKFLDQDTQIFAVDDRLADDLDALDIATRLSSDFDVQIWSGERMVAHVKKGERPLEK